jgi:hypothetical protein
LTLRLLILISLFLTAIPSAIAAQDGRRWNLQYFYDQDEEAFIINDLAFSSPQRGIAVGVITHKKGKPSGYSVVTRDGGAHWTPVPVQDLPESLFLLNDTVGWMVTEKGLWKTDEAGRTWKRIKSMQGIHRVYFLDEMHGWATGAPKLFKETKDGGKSWEDVDLGELKVTAENTYFDWIEWVSQTQGIVLGTSVAPRRDNASWVDPQALAKRREWPGLNITVETKDGGKTWTPQTAPTFGRFARFRMAKVYNNSLTLVRFVNTFQYPSEVYLISPGGKSNRIYRETTRNVTDVFWLGRFAMLAAIEPPGKLHQLPVPGKLHVLSSEDMKTWTEMKVDYRAFGQAAIFAGSGDDLWVATDTGQILKLTNPQSTPTPPTAR